MSTTATAPRYFRGTVCTRTPGTFYSHDAGFLRKVSQELKDRFVKMVMQVYQPKEYDFYMEYMLDYFQGYPIHTVDDPALDPDDNEIIIIRLPPMTEKIGEIMRQFLVDLDGARSAASLTKQLTEFAREWVDVRILLPRGRMLVLHPAAENGLSVGRYDREYFANLLDYVVGPNDVVAADTPAEAHVRIETSSPAMYETYRDESEPAFPSCRDSIVRIQLGARVCYFPIDIAATQVFPTDARYKFTPATCARHLVPGLYARLLEDEYPPRVAQK